jgi:hypothetical protein
VIQACEQGLGLVAPIPGAAIGLDLHQGSGVVAGSSLLSRGVLRSGTLGQT